jgi:hypothetical protein
MARYRRLAAVLAIAGLSGLAVVAIPGKAEAWWCGRVGIGIALPPVVVAPPVYAPPPVYYVPPPAYYPPPQRAWVPPHWQGSVWVPGHWA